MNDFKHQKRLNRLLNVGKKHGILKPFILVIVFFEIAFFHAKMKLIRNATRLSYCVAFLVVFFVFGSFVINVERNDSKKTEVVTEDQVAADYNVTYAVNDIDDTEKLNEDGAIDEYYGEEDDDEFISADDLIEMDYGDSDYAVNKGELENTAIEEFDPSLWSLILINKQHPIPDDYTFELGELKGGMRCDSRVIPSLLLMLQDAKEEGVSLVLCSPYRDADRQVMLFNKKIQKYMKMGYSYADSYLLTSQAVTIPGSSEHQVGLAFDIVTKGYAVLNEGFADTRAGIWLKEHCHEYGFILRYPKGKEDITGIEFEPWHFRYVGVDAATYIMEHDYTLEEFTELIEDNICTN